VAAITSSTFIRSLSDKVLKEASDAKRMSKKLNDVMMPMVLRETEPVTPAERTGMQAGDGPRDPEVNKVLSALASGKYAWRTKESLHHQTGLERIALEKHLQDLLQDGAIVCREDGDGVERWAVGGKANCQL
jgi:hypothetical protein